MNTSAQTHLPLQISLHSYRLADCDGVTDCRRHTCRRVSVLHSKAVVVRTSWLYAAGGSNFVSTMLRLMATRDSVGVVSDQVGTPAWSASLAEPVWEYARRPDVNGIQHWSDDGVASWFDFAVAIQEEALERGLLSTPVPVHAIRTGGYPKVARRPRYSVLDKGATTEALGHSPPHWRVSLRAMLDPRGYT